MSAEISGEACSSSVLKGCLQAFSECLACLGEEMAVGVRRDPDGAVAEVILHLFHAAAVGDKDGRHRVALMRNSA